MKWARNKKILGHNIFLVRLYAYFGCDVVCVGGCGLMAVSPHEVRTALTEKGIKVEYLNYDQL